MICRTTLFLCLLNKHGPKKKYTTSHFDGVLADHDCP